VTWEEYRGFVRSEESCKEKGKGKRSRKEKGEKKRALSSTPSKERATLGGVVRYNSVKKRFWEGEGERGNHAKNLYLYRGRDPSYSHNTRGS